MDLYPWLTFQWDCSLKYNMYVSLLPVESNASIGSLAVPPLFICIFNIITYLGELAGNGTSRGRRYQSCYPEKI